EGWFIGDFGMSETLEKDQTDQKIYGNLPYVAPEVLRKENYTAASDIYSMGIIMWQLVTQQKPYGANYNEIGLELAIVNGYRPHEIFGIPDDYKYVMEKCWAEDPSQRPDLFDQEISFSISSECSSNNENGYKANEIELTNTNND
ncbi:5828_t:CDS:2, partial [Dentiscutata heterogama]